jgi:hypothetical protein
VVTLSPEAVLPLLSFFVFLGGYWMLGRLGKKPDRILPLFGCALCLGSSTANTNHDANAKF